MTSPAPIYQLNTDGTAATTVIDGLNFPAGMACGPDGSLYICLHGDNQIRKYDPKTWKPTIFVGSGKYGYKNGVSTAAEFALLGVLRLTAKTMCMLPEMVLPVAIAALPIKAFVLWMAKHSR
ncbi:hypothetical protein KUH03_35425 [Sphingobacterium sp. E70]|uniref:hypothetical protein n=1 Tax=Sphingobacterium sp. E70 TaxID=2853439 RepID=UPI00211BF72B|nr:hypothetical protein [Sphingobacterium sp. E70]ULT24266.1 hypothetical protein KUH03_35425 [Sphingobacterium sp. E70]